MRFPTIIPREMKGHSRQACRKNRSFFEYCNNHAMMFGLIHGTIQAHNHPMENPKWVHPCYLGISPHRHWRYPPVVTSLSLAIQKLGGLPSIAVRWMGRCEIRRELAAVNIPWILAWKTIPLNWCRIWPIHSTWLAKCQSYWCQIRGSNQFDLWLGRTMEQCHPPTISQPNNSDNDHNG